jgi:type II secretory pathway pseudopilin PulG
MMVHWKQKNNRITTAAFTLIEVLIAFLVFGLVSSGVIFGYVQANRMAEESSESLAAMSYASQGLEQMRSAQWNSELFPPTNGPGTEDELPLTVQSDGTFSYSTNQVDTLDVPTTGNPIYVTNYITVTQISTNPSLRQIVSKCVWTFPLSGHLCTNTIVTLRAPDQ